MENKSYTGSGSLRILCFIMHSKMLIDGKLAEDTSGYHFRRLLTLRQYLGINPTCTYPTSCLVFSFPHDTSWEGPM